MSVVNRVEQVSRPWLDGGTAVMARQVLPGGEDYIELRPAGPSRSLWFNLRGEGPAGILSLADASRRYGSFEFDEDEVRLVEGLVKAALSGDVEITLASFLGWTSPRSVRWDDQEWTFSVSIGRALIPYQAKVVKFEPYR